MLNNLDKIQIDKSLLLPAPTGTRAQIAEELIRRCKELDKWLETAALDAEREGDTDGCWLAMACRSENKRLMDKVEKQIARKE
jgi:hypothetical protein